MKSLTNIYRQFNKELETHKNRKKNLSSGAALEKVISTKKFKRHKKYRANFFWLRF